MEAAKKSQLEPTKQSMKPAARRQPRQPRPEPEPVPAPAQKRIPLRILLLLLMAIAGVAAFLLAV